MHCPGSVAACSKIGDKTSVFAAEGTAAHTLASHCLVHGYNARRFEHWCAGPENVFRPNGPVQALEGRDFIVDDNMIDAVQQYLDHCRSLAVPGDVWLIEERVDMSDLHPDIFGTADFALYSPSRKLLIGRDYKHGKNVAVSVEDNPQLILYMIGAIRKYHNRGVVTVDIGIVQPRSAHTDGSIRTQQMDPIELFSWEAKFRDAAHATDAADAPLIAGDWCKSSFCPAAGNCKAYDSFAMQAALADFEIVEEGAPMAPATHTMPERINRFQKIKLIENWCKKVQEFEHEEALAGRPMEGYKLVPSRARRFWKDPGKAEMSASLMGVPDKKLFTERKLVSPYQVEQALGAKGKRAFAKLDLVDSRSSGSVLAPIEDERAPIKASVSDDFEIVE